MFGYFGAKHQNAHKYQPPKYDTIIEPFAGAAGYACYWLEKGAAKRAILIEKDPRVVELWHRILASTPEDILGWPVPVLGEMSGDLMVTGLGGGGTLESNGLNTVSSRMVKDFDSVRKRIARLRATIGNRIAVVLDDYTGSPDVEATWFVDPPYQHQGHSYRMGSEGIDYRHLEKWVLSRGGQTIVCEADPADWLPWTQRYESHSAANTRGTELVWESDPDPTLFD